MFFPLMWEPEDMFKKGVGIFSSGLYSVVLFHVRMQPSDHKIELFTRGKSLSSPTPVGVNHLAEVFRSPSDTPSSSLHAFLTKHCMNQMEKMVIKVWEGGMKGTLSTARKKQTVH